MVEFLDWVGYRYYRVPGWKWRQIKDEKDKTEYPSVVLWEKFMDSKREAVAKLVCDHCGKEKPFDKNHCECYEGITWIKKAN